MSRPSVDTALVAGLYAAMLAYLVFVAITL